MLTDVSGTGARDGASAVAVQPDGRIVAAGDVEAIDFALARYNRDGTLDASFGSGGTVRTDISGGGSADRATAVALQPDGKIVVAGTSGANGRFRFALVRYDPDGRPDPSFGSGGIVLTDFGTNGYDVAMAVAVSPDGRIVAAGRSQPGPANTDFALARYNRDGSLDSSFGTGGTVVTDIGGSDDEAAALALRTNGAIVVAGRSGVPGGAYDFAVAQYDRRGRLDPRFGTGGIVRTDFGRTGSVDIATGIVLQADGSGGVAGLSNAAGSEDFALARYDPRGRLDPRFGNGGTVLTDISGRGSTDIATAVTLTRNGAIIVAGSSDAAGSQDFALTRYDPRGRLDPRFGNGGTVLTDISGRGSTDIATAVTLTRNGAIIVAGSSDAAGSQDFALARYLP